MTMYDKYINEGVIKQVPVSDTEWNYYVDGVLVCTRNTNRNGPYNSHVTKFANEYHHKFYVDVSKKDETSTWIKILTYHALKPRMPSEAYFKNGKPRANFFNTMAKLSECRTCCMFVVEMMEKALEGGKSPSDLPPIGKKVWDKYFYQYEGKIYHDLLEVSARVYDGKNISVIPDVLVDKTKYHAYILESQIGRLWILNSQYHNLKTVDFYITETDTDEYPSDIDYDEDLDDGETGLVYYYHDRPNVWERRISKPYLEAMVLLGEIKYCETHNLYYCPYHGFGVDHTCPECGAEELGNPKLSLSLFGYSTKAPDILGWKDSPNIKYSGVELEYELAKGVNHADALYEIYTKVKNHVICKRDGSLLNGVEIVTVPAKFEEHYKKFQPFFDSPHFEWFHSKETTGMHVHVDRRKMGYLQVGKILHFMRELKNKEFLKLLAGRESRYAQLGTGEKIHEFAHGKQTNRYNAVNTQNEHTLEFRIFSTPTTFNKFCTNMEFCDALTLWSAPANSGIKEIEYGGFIQFVNKNRGLFPNLAKFVKETY